MMRIFLNLYVLVFVFSTEATALSASWHDCKARGWSWYEEELDEELEEPVYQSPSKVLEKEKGILEEKMARALLDPSPQNVSQYIEEQNKWVNQSSLFANAWMKALLEHPEYDPRVQNPISQYGSQIRKELQRKEKELLLESLAKTHGIFFFFEGASPYSQAMSKVLKVFSMRYGWEIFPVSIDGQGTQDFLTPEINNGMAESLQIQQLPAVFAANPISKELIPLSFGLTSLDVLERNVQMQFSSDQEVSYVDH